MGRPNAAYGGARVEGQDGASVLCVAQPKQRDALEIAGAPTSARTWIGIGCDCVDDTLAWAILDRQRDTHPIQLTIARSRASMISGSEP